ncbi:MAG TPA: hypothetical protein VG756_27010 [Pseudonocardiaceae bacterium]|jgi:hypothetical protein|nr:hypothetical protein [Pseudonocardiaceae bacterium]
MRVTGYAYPWDVLEEPGFLDRATELGVREIAVAASYHAVRAATPWSAERTAVLAEHAALYRPVREKAWSGKRLRPAAATWTRSADSAGDAVRTLSGAGIAVAPWLVLTHNSLLGRQNPDLTVRNCYGESYPWALCPSAPEVREFAVTLAAECVRELDVRTVIVESCGPMGLTHQYMHEKTDGVFAPAAARLLSVCCCPACTADWPRAGLPIEATIALLRKEIRRLLDTGDLGLATDELPAEVSEALLNVRHRAVDELRAGVLGALDEVRVVLHGSPDPWATGALPGLTPNAANEVDAVVVPCWQPGPAALDAVRAARNLAKSTVDIGAYVTAVAAAPVPDLPGCVRELAAAGASELHLYHLGLAGPARWPDLRQAVAAAPA